MTDNLHRKARCCRADLEFLLTVFPETGFVTADKARGATSGLRFGVAFLILTLYSHTRPARTSAGGVFLCPLKYFANNCTNVCAVI